MMIGYRAPVRIQGAINAFHDLVIAHCRTTGDTQADLAQFTHANPTTFSQWLNGKAAMPLAAAVDITRGTRRFEGAQAIAQAMGGYFVPLPQDAGADKTYLAAVATMRETTEAATKWFDAVADGKVSETERAACLREINEAMTAMATFHRMVAGGGK